jgi:hypothetical protein
MNREDIIRMALEVGLEQDGDNFFSPKSDPQVDVHITDLEAFAALVASAEREACAKVCEDSVEYAGDTLAKAIRARGSHD